MKIMSLPYRNKPHRNVFSIVHFELEFQWQDLEVIREGSFKLQCLSSFFHLIEVKCTFIEEENKSKTCPSCMASQSVKQRKNIQH